MQNQRVRLVYVSRNRLVGDACAVLAQIENILAAARRRNLQNHVTGALLFNSGVFAQCLEGRREDVEKIFALIEQDPRHADIRVLSIEPMTSRLFPGWSMGFLGANRIEENLFGHIADRTGLDLSLFESEQTLKLMREIAAAEEAAAS